MFYGQPLSGGGVCLGHRILYTSFLAPITEEIFFHGIIFNTARKKHSNLYAIIISSLLFAIGHMNGIQFISGMFMGIVIECAIILTDNVYIGIIIHVANNAFSLINANLLNSIWGQEYWQVYVQMFVGIIMLVIGFFMLWRENINKYPNEDLYLDNERIFELKIADKNYKFRLYREI